MPLVFKNGDQTLRTLKEILQRCKDHLPGKDFGKCLYEKPERATTTIYPKLRYYGGRFSTSIYEGDIEVSPLRYLGVRCSARAVICVEGILLGDTTTLLIKVYEAEVSERKEPERPPPKRRLLSKGPVVKTVTEKRDDVKEESDTDSCTRDFCGMNGWRCYGCTIREREN